jgi:hypothetical protein
MSRQHSGVVTRSGRAGRNVGCTCHISGGGQIYLGESSQISGEREYIVLLKYVAQTRDVCQYSLGSPLVCHFALLYWYVANRFCVYLWFRLCHIGDILVLLQNKQYH